VNFFAHALAQSGIDELVPLHAAAPGELGGHHDGLEMLPVAHHLDVLAGEPGFDAVFHAFGGNQWRFSFYVLSLYPDLSSTRQIDATAANAIMTIARLTPGGTSEEAKKP
jgi:hypothetical protein